MRPEPFSSAEEAFFLQTVQAEQRLDGRTRNDFRNLKLLLGKGRGSCIAMLGKTKILASVSCELGVPKPGRPHEGSIFVNLEMSPMADPCYEYGRLGDGGIEICRLLERIIKECNCIDTESLCIQAGEKVWHIRVDVHVLDNDGGLIDCASAAALTALIHFRRPDVSVVGETVIIHGEDEREPVGLNLYHHPVAVTFGFVEEGTISFVDPTEREEHILEGTVIYVMNSRREICALHCSGGLTVNKTTVMKCGAQALTRALQVTEQIRAQIAKDAESRSKGSIKGFVEDIWVENVTGFDRDSIPLTYDGQPSTSGANEELEGMETDTPKLKKENRTVHMGNGSRLMNEPDSGDDDIEILDHISAALERSQVTEQTEEFAVVKKRKKKSKKALQNTNAQNQSEKDDLLDAIEDDVHILGPEDMGYEKKIESPEPVEKIDFTMAIKAKKKKKAK